MAPTKPRGAAHLRAVDSSEAFARPPAQPAESAPVRAPSSQTAMVITKTPYRISFFGGGTDYPQWYLKEGGAVLSTTIDKYCYLSCRVLPPFFQTRHRVVWSHVETVSTIAEILHPAVRNALQYLGFDDSEGIEIHHQGDLPARSGIGSSSSFSVGILRALAALRGKVVGKKELAQRAIELEQSVMKELVGSQDQVAAAYGGLNLIEFRRNGDIQVEPLTIGSARRNDFQSRLMLLYTGTSRLCQEMTKSFVENIGAKEQRLRTMRAMVDRAVTILASDGDLDEFGQLLHENWMLKRELGANISNAKIDGLYERARNAGALGGKLLGAGHSGFMLFYVPPERQAAVMAAMPDQLWVPFAFDKNGCTLVHYND
jgi:D-glycero-alpha-D-manno-heptose-7-phosphate kinase